MLIVKPKITYTLNLLQPKCKECFGSVNYTFVDFFFFLI